MSYEDICYVNQHPYQVIASSDVPCPGGCGEQVRMIRIVCLVCERVSLTLEEEDAIKHEPCLPNVA